jgi:superfamily II DNA or RNA helicase
MPNRLGVGRNINKRVAKQLNVKTKNYNLPTNFRNTLNTSSRTEFVYQKKTFTSQKNAEMAVKALIAGKKNIAKAWVKNGNTAMRRNVSLNASQKAMWDAKKNEFKRNIAIARAIANERYRKALMATKNAQLVSKHGKVKKYLMNARSNVLRRFPPATAPAAHRVNEGAPLPAPVTVRVRNQEACTPACVRISKMPLRDYQKRVCKVMRSQRGLIVVHSVGTGKTLTAVTASQCFLADNPGAKVFVLTPVTLMDNFRKAMRAYGISNSDSRYVIISHQMFLSRYKEAVLNRKVINRNGIQISSDPFRGHMVIIDEAHVFRTQPLIKKQAGQAYDTDARWMIRATRSAERVLCLTATPFFNTEKDLLNLVAMTKSGNTPNNNKTTWKNLFSFYERDHADPNFPKVNMFDVKVPMSMDYYRDYERVFLAERAHFPKNVNISESEAFLLKMRQLVGGFKKNQEENPKAEWVLNKVVEVLEKKGRVVIYATFKDTGIGRVEEQFKKFKIHFNAIHGDIPAKERTRIIDEYNSGRSPVLLITQAGGVGIDLKKTSDMILFDNVWNPANEEQIIGRGVRFGSHADLPKEKQVVNVHRLVLDLPPGANTSGGVFSADLVMTKQIIEPKRAKMAAVLNDIRTKYAIERSRQ